MSFATFELCDRVGIVTLNRPDRLNAISDALLDDLHAAFAEARDCERARVLVLTGAGRAFCAGEDLKEFGRLAGDEATARRHIASIQQVTRRLIFDSRLVVAAARGYAVGGGFEWLLNCDLAVVGRDLVVFLPELKWGQFPTGGLTYLLPRDIGYKRAMALLALGERLGAERLVELGLANRVVEPDHVLSRAVEIANRIAEQIDADSAAQFKRLVRGELGNVSRALDLEEQATLKSFLRPESSARSREFIRGRDRPPD